MKISTNTMRIILILIFTLGKLNAQEPKKIIVTENGLRKIVQKHSFELAKNTEYQIKNALLYVTISDKVVMKELYNSDYDVFIHLMEEEINKKYVFRTKEHSFLIPIQFQYVVGEGFAKEPIHYSILLKRSKEVDAKILDDVIVKKYFPNRETKCIERINNFEEKTPN